MFIYAIKRNPSLRALLITIFFHSVVLTLIEIKSRNAVGLFILSFLIVYGVAVSYKSISGKTPCRLSKIESGKLFKIIFHKKSLPLLLWGVDAPEKNQKCHELSVAWLEDFIVGKSLSFSDVEYIEYREGVLPPKHSKYTSMLYADGQDVALEALRKGYLYLNESYKTNQMYRDAANVAESKNRGIHKYNEARPNIVRAKAEVIKNINKKKTLENAEGAVTWMPR